MIDNISSLIEKYKDVEADMLDQPVEEAPYIHLDNLEQLHVKLENDWDGIISSDIELPLNKVKCGYLQIKPMASNSKKYVIHSVEVKRKCIELVSTISLT
jgi:hypothetical protein